MKLKRLKELRLDAGLTQKQLGEILYTHYHSISTYENGKRTPNADFVLAAAEYFGVTTDYLLERDFK